MAIREILTVPDPRLKEVSKPVEGGVTDEIRALMDDCLSVPDIFDEVERPTECRVRYLDYDGFKVDEVATGMYAVCIQHEMDHLEGTLFIDHLSRLKRQRAIDKVKKAKRLHARESA